LILDIEIGGLLILEEISLLKTVFVKAESVLLDRNLKSYNNKITIKTLTTLSVFSYFDEKMNVEIGASRVALIRVLNSTSFYEINTLYK